MHLELNTWHKLLTPLNSLVQQHFAFLCTLIQQTYTGEITATFEGELLSVTSLKQLYNPNSNQIKQQQGWKTYNIYAPYMETENIHLRTNSLLLSVIDQTSPLFFFNALLSSLCPLLPQYLPSKEREGWFVDDNFFYYLMTYIMMPIMEYELK